MKKLALFLSLLLTTPAFADGYHRHGGHRGGGYNWVAPVIIGGAIGYVLAQPRTVYVSPPPSVVYQNTYPPYGYHYETILDSYCNCYRTVLVPN